MSRYAWLTPEDAPGELVCFQVYCPLGEEWEAAVRGALLPLCDPENWESKGAQTPEDTAAAFLDAIAQTYVWQQCEEGGGGVVVAIGSVLNWSGGGDLPAGFLECDGAEYEESAYPDLFAVIGDTFGSSGAGYFNVPDLRSRMCVGVGQGAGLTERVLADIGGEETHVLTINELAQHHHTVGIATSNYQLGATTLQRPGAATTTDTGETGINSPHENMPPFLALRYIIAAVEPG